MGFSLRVIRRNDWRKKGKRKKVRGDGLAAALTAAAALVAALAAAALLAVALYTATALLKAAAVLTAALPMACQIAAETRALSASLAVGP